MKVGGRMSWNSRLSRIVVLSACAASGCAPFEPDLPPLLVSTSNAITQEDQPVTIDVLGLVYGLGGKVTVVAASALDGHQATISSGRYIEIHPRKDFHGTFKVTYVVIRESKSHETDSTHGAMNVTVRPRNDPPVAAASTLAVRDFATVMLMGSDVDGDSIRYEVVEGPMHGTLAGVPPWLSYTPEHGFFGEDRITYRVHDSESVSEPATLRLDVGIGPFPIALSDTISVVEDQPQQLVLRAVDEDGDVLTYTIVTPPSSGELTMSPPNVLYTPAKDFFGFDLLQFAVSDGTNTSSTATLEIFVQPVADPPVPESQTVDVSEDIDRAITLAASDGDGDLLTFLIAEGPQHGTLIGSPPHFTYRPALNYHGPDRLTYRVSDGQTMSEPATVTVEVASIEDPPVASPISRSLPEDGSTIVTLVGSDGDGDPVSVAIAAQPAHGALVVSGASVTYTPAPNYNGPDSFTYTASSGNLTSTPAIVSLAVASVNDSPVAIGGTVVTMEDTAIAIVLQGSDIETASPTFTVTQFPVDGVLSGTGANRMYTPALNKSGTRNLTFRVADGSGAIATATVAIEITPVNDPPIVSDDFVTTAVDTLFTFGPASNDVDPEGDSVALDSIDAPAHGDIEIVAGELVYTPDPGFIGTDVVGYTVIDAHGASSNGKAHIGVGVFPPGAPTETISLIGGPVAAGTQRAAALSLDSRYIAFASALPLVASDSNGLPDIYLFDRGTGALTRVSTATSGDSNGASQRPHLSGDGRYVVFDSDASNLVAGDSNSVSDVFRHDRVTGETVRISVTSDGTQASGASTDPEISEDASVVAFVSAAFDLVANDVNGATDVFVRDLTAGTTVRVSVTATGSEADLGSLAPALSGNGRHIAFSSLASNLVAGDSNGVSDVFVRDRIAGTTTRVSVSSNGVEANSKSVEPSLSRDGRFVSFLSDATSLVGGITQPSQLYVRDTQQQTTTHPLTTEPVSWGRLSADGRYLTAFRPPSGGVIICDRFAGTTVTPSGASGWLWPMISGNGRYVVVLANTGGGSLVVTPNPL